jgi:hypothetical protein
MSIEQTFVGAVAILLGLVCAAAGLFEISWFFRLPKAQWAEARWGRRATRVGFGLLGLSLILLGCYIVAGIPLPRDG